MDALFAPLLVITALALLESLYSLQGGLSFLRLFRKFHTTAAPERLPPVSLILPCRGIDPGLDLNLNSFLALQYPDFRLIFAVESVSDACLDVIRQACRRNPRVDYRVVVAGKAECRGQKVHNLLAALEEVRPEDEVIAFADSDIRPHPGWLQDLVGALRNPEVGISTGFRWYLPESGRPASVLRAVWNAGIASLMRERNCYFAWGGAMALRRQVFEGCDVRGRWNRALSDDYAMSRAIQEQGLSIHFQPRCLSFSHEDCSLRELWNWSYRQLCITRVYHPGLWRAALISHTINVTALWGGAAFVAVQLFSGLQISGIVIGLLAGAAYLAGVAKGWLRLQAVQELFPEKSAALGRHRWAYRLWGPLAALVSLAALLRTLWSREIEWRGIRYRMVSPAETLVLGEE